MLCALLLVLIGELVPPVLVFLVLFGALSVVVMRVPRPWPAAVAIAVALLFAVGNAPFVAEDLAHPETVAGFAPSWLLLLGTIFVVVAAAMVLRRGAGALRPVVTGFGALAMIGVILSAAMSASLDDDVRQPGDVLVAAEDVEYPEEVRVPTSGAVLVENHDAFRHTFVIEDEEVKQEVPGSTSRRIELDLPPGTYSFYCDVPGHEAMEGSLIVE